MKVYLKIFENLNLKNGLDWKVIEINSKITLKNFLNDIGIPAYKIDFVVINGKYKNFDYILKENDHIEILLFKPFVIDFNLNFICDEHLGKLAKYLRMLGFDTIISFHKRELIGILLSEDRILLTKDRKLTTFYKVKSCTINSSEPFEQLKEVVFKFNLFNFSKPFTRCLICNDLLDNIDKNLVIDFLPPKVKEYQNEFFKCKGCSKIYWKGTHYDKMVNFIREFEKISF